ncbi:MAG: serine protein kinase RIO [Candidatus Heimdallarchaeota archaeon]|nr:serine protein kinase RIO [Candidatus Heimdallarchaeota archaeon]
MTKGSSKSKKEKKVTQEKKKKYENDFEKDNIEEPLLNIETDTKTDKELRNADQLQVKMIDDKKAKTKDVDDLKVVESVLDIETRTTLYNLRKKNIVDYFTGIISTGKEANVYHAYAPDKSELAVKIYRTSTNVFKGLQIYIIGDPRFSNIKRDQRSFVYAWSKKEFKNLSRAYAAKVKVPKPIICIKDVVVMEFIGKDGLPYRLMKDQIIEDPDATYKEVLSNLKKLYNKAGLVHADLSEYNMIYTPEVYFIDISQAVLVEHPYSEIFLFRDIKNITRYFYSQGAKVQDPDRLYEKLVGEPPSDKVLAFEL